MMTVNEVSKLSGVSIRSLHHYDKIGLLPATEVTAAGYRLYDDKALERLQMILLFKELQFPLKGPWRVESGAKTYAPHKPHRRAKSTDGSFADLTEQFFVPPLVP